MYINGPWPSKYQELNNGRMAMFAIIGQISAELVTGLLAPKHGGQAVYTLLQRPRDSQKIDV